MWTSISDEYKKEIYTNINDYHLRKNFTVEMSNNIHKDYKK